MADTSRIRLGGYLLEASTVTRGEEILAGRLDVNAMLERGFTVRECFAVLHYVYDRQRGVLPAPGVSA